MSARRALAAALAAAVLLAGCGGDSDSPSPPPRQAEKADSVPQLPKAWEVHTNRGGGFTFGLPPGWKARNHGTTTEVRSYDGLVVLSIAADRTTEALSVDPADAATRTLASLPGFERAPDPSEPRELEHEYVAYEADANARSAASGVEQDLTVVVLRREGAVSVTVLIAANADKRSRAARRIADRVVSTLRTQPPRGAAR